MIAEKSIEVMEETKAIVREAAEVGKTAAGMLKDIKSQGIQSRGSTALSYAAISRGGRYSRSKREGQTECADYIDSDST